jgi:hypothetical protein
MEESVDSGKHHFKKHSATCLLLGKMLEHMAFSTHEIQCASVAGYFSASREFANVGGWRGSL